MTRCPILAMSALLLLFGTAVPACSRGAAKLNELQKVKSGSLDVVILSPRDALKHDKDDFIVEFRSSDGQLVDVGNVRASASMSMSGVPMLGSVAVQRTDVPGRYRADGEFSMAGTWRVTIEWGGPAGNRSVTFPGAVQ